jgi:rare lipoprotein A
MLDEVAYEARRARLLFVALVVGLGLIAFVVRSGGATDAAPAASAGRARATAPASHSPRAAATTRSTLEQVRLDAPATLLVSDEVTTTTATPPTTAPPTTAPSAVRRSDPPPTAPPTTTPPPTTAPRPTAGQSGTATYYEGGSSHGCAHRTLPFGTVVTVTAVSSGRSVTCTVDDRGPFGSPIIDLSPSGFSALAPLSAGVISVRISW